MTNLSFNELSFEEKEEKIMVNFQNLFYFELDKRLLEEIGGFTINRDSIIFPDIPEKRVYSRFNMILEHGLNNIKSRLSNKKVIYIHRNSGIPLIGTNYFGIIDRGTNIVEVKPMNGCNLDCIYCSVDEGFSSKRPVDFIIERDYLVNEFRKLLEFKNTTNIHANIAGQGETLMYPEIVELVREIRQIHSVDIISIITNGTMLTELLIDKLVSAGLTRLNISLNAIDKGLADKIANKPYNIEKVKEMIRYASKRLQVILVPVLIPGINDAEIDKIIEFSKSICMEGGNVKLGIQNFLSYRFGRNPVNEISWGEFYERLAGLEKVHNINLKY
ncbi:MAG: radical SAM protein, partial [Nanoarchaeota archaeon]